MGTAVPAATADLNRRVRWASFVIAFVGVAFALVSTSQMWRGQFNDSDDYMRMVQVFSLLDGQGWFDLRQPRLGPGENFILDWSRFVDVPLAAVILFAEPWVGRMAAAGVAAFMVPLLLLAAFVFALPLLGRGLLPKVQAWMLVVVLLTSFPILREMRPMRVDHHGWQLLLALLAYVALLRYALRPRAMLRLWAGLACAAGWAIGAEALLWSGLAFGWVALDSAWRGGRTARHGALFGLGLLLGVLVLLPTVRPVAEWGAHHLTRLALPHVVLAVLSAGLLLLLHAAAADARRWRLILLGSGGILAMAALLAFMPEILRGGIYAGMQAENRRLILGHVLEAQSFAARLGGLQASWASLLRHWPILAHTLVVPTLALMIVVVQVWRRRGYRRRLWGVQLAFLLPVCLIGWCWQSRVMTYMQLYALLPVAWLALAGWRRVQRTRREVGWIVRPAYLALLVLPTVVTPLLTLQVPWVQIALYPAWHQRKPCDLREVAHILDDPKGLGDRPRNIMTTMTGGAELLFRTRHRVYSAPYDLPGNRMVADFMAARDFDAARRLAGMQGVDLVLVCDAYTGNYFPDDAARSAALIAAAMRQHGHEPPEAVDRQRVLIDRLSAGDVPVWLMSLPLPDSHWRLYRVR
ncbi:MAG: hypothetical protein WBK91_07590 [Alphaproteobacteria bacterium]